MSFSKKIIGLLINSLFVLCFLNLALIPFAHYGLTTDHVLTNVSLMVISLSLLSLLQYFIYRLHRFHQTVELGFNTSVEVSTPSGKRTNVAAAFMFYGFVFSFLYFILVVTIWDKAQSGLSSATLPKPFGVLAVDVFCGFIFLVGMGKFLYSRLSPAGRLSAS